MNKTIKILQAGIICLSFILGSYTAGHAQNFSEKFTEAAGSKITSVATVNAELINMLKKKETNNQLQAFLNELSLLKVITMKNDAGTIKNYCDVAQSLLQKNDYQELFVLQENKQQVKIAVRGKTAQNKAGEIVMLVCQEEQLTVVDLVGNITIDKIGDLAASIRKSMLNL